MGTSGYRRGIQKPRNGSADCAQRPQSRSGHDTIQLLKADGTFPFNIVSATFEPGKRLDWHKDPGGQILIITEGSGYFEEKGQPKQLVRKGDIVKSAARHQHWHGAASEIGTTHIAITPGNESGTKWLEKVTDKEYSADAVALKKHAE